MKMSKFNSQSSSKQENANNIGIEVASPMFRRRNHDLQSTITNFPIVFDHAGTSSSHASAAIDEPGEIIGKQEMNPESVIRKNEPIMPSLAICLRFEDVKFKARMNEVKNRSTEGEKYILQGVSGAVNPGELLAMIGPSGGGKTTLLNLLSGRLTFNSGTITYNNLPYSKSLKRKIGYVTQDDLVFPHLTVKETLTYVALLRLPKTLTKQQKQDRAMEVIMDLGLERCQNLIIGGGGGLKKGISGGERKRVCIGNEVLLDPCLLLLDEPTSSLDSSSALRIVQLLQNMAKAGKTVVTTIHQPSSRLFSKFDKLILLGRGSSLYFGKASEAMKYFSSMGCSPLIAMNPAEFLLDLANGNMNEKSIPLHLEHTLSPTNSTCRPSQMEVHKYFVEECESRSWMIRNGKTKKATIEQSDIMVEYKRCNSKWKSSWWDQFCVLVSRGFKERKHEYFSCTRVIQVILTAIIVGLLWLHPNYSSSIDTTDQAGLIFFISVFWGFFPLFTAIFTFPQERVMLIKERSVGMYKLSAYFAARNITDLPLDLVLPTFFMLIMYFMVGLKPNFAAFFLTLLAIFLNIVASQGLGLSIGAAFMDIKKALTLASILIMSFMLSAGFFIHPGFLLVATFLSHLIRDVPGFMSWLRYVSFNYHTNRLLLRIQFGCSSESLKYGRCEAPIIKGLKVDYSGKHEIGALIIMIIGYRFIAYLFLKRMKFRPT